MKRGSAFLITSAMAVFFSLTSESEGSERETGDVTGAEGGASVQPAGVRTHRLSPRQLRVWRKIKGIIFAKDAAGRSLHPTLERLWRQVESSGHTILIEMPAPAVVYMAGKFTVEKIDPEGKNHLLSIRLHLSTIDLANTSDQARRADGFIPFEKLDRERRYAEVLAHELTHAVLTLQDPAYVALSNEQDRLEAELHARSRRDRKVVFDEENKLRMRRLNFLANLIESQANAAEIEVWRELVQSCGKNRYDRTIDKLALLRSGR